MSSRMKAISKLIQAVYMQPNQLDVLIDVFAKQVTLMGKKIKSGEALASAKERIKSDEFIKQFAPSFDEFSIEEINSLANFFNSETMKKYYKVSIGSPEVAALYQAIQQAFVATPEDN